MIIRELYEERENGTKLYRTYSDLNVQIRQIETGYIYDEAIDLENKNYTYEETEFPIVEIEELNNYEEEELLGQDYHLQENLE